MEPVQKLACAIRARDTEQAKMLLEQRPELAQAMSADGSLILLAIYYGSVEIAEMLRRSGCPLAIFEAAAFGDVDRVRACLATEPSLVEAFDDQGGTALHLAAFFGRREIVDLLLAAGADINVMSRFEMPHIPRNTPLHAALAARQWEVAERLIDCGAEINAVDNAGFTPLHHAVGAQNAVMAQLLLERGARVDVQNKRGQTPLDMARRRDHTEILDLLQRWFQVD